MSNLVLLCTRHHHTIHDRDVTIVHDGRGRMRFILADGRMLAPSPSLDGASAEALPLDTAAPHPDAATVLEPAAYQPRIDLAACVDALLRELNLLEPPPSAAYATAA